MQCGVHNGHTSDAGRGRCRKECIDVAGHVAGFTSNGKGK